MGDKLDVEAAAETAGLRPAHTYVPWVTVNGVPLGAAYTYLKTIVCAAYTGERCGVVTKTVEMQAVHLYPHEECRNSAECSNGVHWRRARPMIVHAGL